MSIWLRRRRVEVVQEIDDRILEGVEVIHIQEKEVGEVIHTSSFMYHD